MDVSSSATLLTTGGVWFVYVPIANIRTDSVPSLVSIFIWIFKMINIVIMFFLLNYNIGKLETMKNPVTRNMLIASLLGNADGI